MVGDTKARTTQAPTERAVPQAILMEFKRTCFWRPIKPPALNPDKNWIAVVKLISKKACVIVVVVSSFGCTQYLAISGDNEHRIINIDTADSQFGT